MSILLWLVTSSLPAQAESLDACTKKQCVHRKTFFDGFRAFHGEGLNEQSVDSVRLVLNRWDSTEEWQDTRWLAYILATAYHETARLMHPVREGLKDDDDSVVQYLRGRKRQGFIRTVYWDPDPVTKKLYYGRGMVQLTHRRNYSQVGAYLGGDLVLRLGDEPDTALDPSVSVDALMRGMVEGWYNESKAPHRGKGLGYYINDDVEDDRDAYIHARRTVNKITPLDDAHYSIAAYADTIHTFIKMVGPDEFESRKMLAPRPPRARDLVKGNRQTRALMRTTWPESTNGAPSRKRPRRLRRARLWSRKSILV